MKLMFASDIHGSAYWAKKILERFESEEADYLVLLGDILYHGHVIRCLKIIIHRLSLNY